MKPLLSICIPTYNRARLLESALNALAPQINAHYPEVELIISDNASTDSTREVVERWQDQAPIRYHRNSDNLGFYGNLFVLTDELAQGEFAWVIGDDDLVRPDGVERVLNVIRSYPDIDYIFVNTTTLKQVERLNKGDQVSGEDFPGLYPLKCADLSERLVDTWDELIDPKIDEVFLGAAMLSVFRLWRWQQAKASMQIDPEQNFRLNYFNTEILAKAFKGRKAYYLGYPCTIAFSGGQDWVSFRPIVVLVLLQDLLDNYLKHGIDPARIEMCRAELLDRSVEAFKVILSRRGREMPQRQQFSLLKFLWHNRKQKLWAFFKKVFEPSIPIVDDSLRDYALPPHEARLHGEDARLVSVIVTTSPEQYSHLEETLQSVQGCNDAKCEVIVVDDGLSNADQQSAGLYSGSNRYFRQRFSNQAAARNFGIAQAKGDLVAFLHAGDHFLPGKVDIQVRFFGAYPQIGLCYSSYMRVGAPHAAPLQTPGDGMYVKTNELAGRCYYHLLKFGSDIETSTVMVPKPILDAAGGFDESLGSYADLDLWQRIARRHEVAMTTQPLARIADRGSSSGCKAIDELRLWRKTYQGDNRIGWRYRRKTYARLYLNAVVELYARWDALPPELSTPYIRHITLLCLFYAPGKILRPEVAGLLARTLFPRGLYNRLRPLWRRWMGAQG